MANNFLNLCLRHYVKSEYGCRKQRELLGLELSFLPPLLREVKLVVRSDRSTSCWVVAWSWHIVTPASSILLSVELLGEVLVVVTAVIWHVPVAVSNLVVSVVAIILIRTIIIIASLASTSSVESTTDIASTEIATTEIATSCSWYFSSQIVDI